MTTQELVKWLLMVAANDAAHEYTNRADHMRLAADRLSEMDAEINRLREALERVLLDVEFMWEDGTLPNRRDDVIYVRARAAADKIRAALTQEKQT